MSDHDQGSLYEKLEAFLQWPMMVLTVAFLVAVIVPLESQVDPAVEQAARRVESIVWALFLGEYLLLFLVARNRLLYLRTHIFEAIVVMVPAFRLFRLTRILRLTRLLNLLRIPSMIAIGLRGVTVANAAFRRYRLGYILMVMLVLLLIASGLMLCVERAANPSLCTYFRCLWWGVVTMTTVGYGDVAPVTAAGRAVAMLFMLFGIGLAGVVTATVASVFVGIERRDEDQELRDRFSEVEGQLREMSAQLKTLVALQSSSVTAKQEVSEPMEAPQCPIS